MRTRVTEGENFHEDQPENQPVEDWPAITSSLSTNLGELFDEPSGRIPELAGAVL
jgi:hypothetical protein